MTNLTKLAKSAVSLSCLPTLPCKFFLLNSNHAPNRYRFVNHLLFIQQANPCSFPLNWLRGFWVYVLEYLCIAAFSTLFP